MVFLLSPSSHLKLSQLLMDLSQLVISLCVQCEKCDCSEGGAKFVKYTTFLKDNFTLNVKKKNVFRPSRSLFLFIFVLKQKKKKKKQDQNVSRG